MKRTARMVIEVDYDDTLCDIPETPETWETDPRDWGSGENVRVVEVVDPGLFDDEILVDGKAVYPDWEF